MFANPIWSVLLMLAPFAVYYFIIRPRLESKLTDTFSHVQSFWGRVRARLWEFATFWIATAGAVITALPDILVVLTPIDFSPWLPHPWPAYTAPACTILITIIRALKTKPV